MARPVRVNVAGGWYHVTARGIERRAIFEDGRDHKHFLELLSAMTERYGVEIHAYALMGNHYHLLLETTQPNISKVMHSINTAYTTYYNVTQGYTQG